jgi:hypothetical protein
MLVGPAASAQTPPPSPDQPAEPAPAEQEPGQPPGPPPAAEAAPPSADPPPAAANPAAPAPRPIVSKGDITLYGVVDFTVFHDSVQNLGGEAAGNAAIAREGTYAGDHGRTQFSARGSRVGLRLGAPEFSGIKVTGLVEADFVGNQPPGTEAAFYTSPTFRTRHFWGKISTSVLDVTFGQTWQLFGLIPSSVGYSVMVPGLPGELYTRNPQIRLSRIVKGEAVNIEMAVAAARPPQRDSGTPDGQAGLRVLINRIQGMRTPGPGAPVIEPLSLGISGIARRFSVPEFTPGATDSLSTTGFGVAADFLVPIIPARSKEDHVGALTLTGEAVYGEGISDLYTGFNAGITLPATFPAEDGMPPVAYTPNIDNGLVALTLDGTSLEAIQWTTMIAGLQYYVKNNLWLAVNGSYLRSSNIGDLTPEGREGSVYEEAFFVDGAVAWDITPAARVGFEVARFQQTYVDDEDATSFRVQFGSWYMF